MAYDQDHDNFWEGGWGANARARHNQSIECEVERCSGRLVSFSSEGQGSGALPRAQCVSLFKSKIEHFHDLQMAFTYVAVESWMNTGD